MFDRLFKPKWQHSDPRKRQVALESGNVPAEALVKVAREDSDPDVRCCAIQRLDDLDLLAELFQSDPTSQVREAVEQRLSELLARPLEQSPSLDERLAIIRRAEVQGVCGLLVKTADAVEIRSAALAQVTDTQLLCAVSIDDPVASVRLMALDRISEPAGWEIVSRNARNKDKKICRAARDRLESFRKAQADEEAAERLCGEMDDLLGSASLQTDSQAKFLRLCSQWERLTASLPPQISERFDQARNQVSTRIDQFELLMNQRRAICTELDTLLERLQEGGEDNSDSSDELAERMNGINEQWQATDPDVYNDNPVTQRFAKLQAQVHQESERLARDRVRLSKLRELISKAEALQDNPARLDESRIKQLQQRWNELEKPEASRLRETMHNQFEGALHGLREHLVQQTKQRKKALEEAEKLIPELEDALKQGELERALSLRDRISHRLKLAKGIAEQRRSALQKQLSAIHGKLDELRKWRHWGSGHARDHLCVEIEELIDSPLSPDEIASKVRTARKAWQRIDHAEGPADEALWQRFDKACTSAYEPYQEERKKQEEVLNQHLAQKEKLCGELDEYEHNTDWENVDWREADQYIHKSYERWRRIGAVPRKASKKLEKKYRAVLDRLESHLQPERESELRRRRTLIARVEELSKSSDLRAASREVKEAQDKWKPTVPLPRKEEQELWQQFRTVCDAVFNQIREERNAADAERQANLERKQAICAELEVLLDQPEKTYREIHKQFATSSDEWAEIGEIPRKQERAIETRYEAIRERLAERHQQEAKAAVEARLQVLRERSQLCARLEHDLLDKSMEESEQQTLLEQASQDWQALPDLDSDYGKSLQQRYELVSRALQGDSAAQQTLQDALPMNLQQRLQLCLQMEVAAGVESPPEYADARMEYQVSLLSDALQQKYTDEQTREERLSDLQIDWLLAGPVKQEERAKLEMRFEHTLKAGG